MTDSAPTSDPLNDLDHSGKRIGDYHVLRRLGKGGMAEVYLAHQQSLDRAVALKTLRNKLAGDESYVRRFHHEAKAAANLAHANIVQIFEVGDSDGVHFIAQEYVQGQNVKQYIARHGAVGTSLAVSIMRQVAAALVKASEQGVIHRDIKPENIMLSPGGEVKVADFGLARVTRSEAGNELTQVGITLGTPLYMSPEQVEGGNVDPRSDLYSLGVTCYEMLSGRPPYEGETALAVAVKHLNEEPPSLESVRPDVPTELCAVIRKLMGKKAKDRYQSAADLLRDLREITVNDDEDRWSDTLHQLNYVQNGTNADFSRTSEQQRLAALMREERRASRVSPTRWLIGLVALMLVGFMLGTFASWLNPPPDLLQVDPLELEQVPLRLSAEEQYRLAYQLRSEQAWLAVARNFPPQESNQNRYYAQLADVRLAELYLREDRFNDALERFQAIQQGGTLDREFELLGLAGEAIVYDRLGRESDARRALITFDDHFQIHREESGGRPRNWSEFFSDNEYIRGLLAQLRQKLNWDEPTDVPLNSWHRRLRQDDSPLLRVTLA